MNANCTCVMAALVILAGGCAKSHLSVKVDVYADDPLVDSLANPDRLMSVQLAIEKAGPLAQEIAGTRKELMGQYEGLYLCYCRIAQTIAPKLNVNLEGATRHWTEPKRLYDAEIDGRAALVEARAKEALDVMNRFIPIASRVREGKGDSSLSGFFDAWKELRSARSALVAAMERVTEQNLGTKYEKIAQSVSEIGEDVQQALARAPRPAQPDELRKQSADFNAQLAQIGTLARKIRAFDQAVASLKETTAAIESAAKSTDPNLISNGMTKAMRTAFEVSGGPGPNLTPEAQTLIGQIGSSFDFMNTQIDRLQDPSDPAWRILSRAENQGRWQTFYAETVFDAEGKTDVVFVRDRLGHFRLQRGKNNPTALIQGQFKITRAVASGLVDVLAAAAGAAGIPGVATGLPKIVPASPAAAAPQNRAQEKASPAGVDIAGDARKEQRLQSSARLRHALLRKLEELQTDLKSAPAGTLSPERLESLRSTLKGFQELVKSLKQEDT
jgi:hypothetical protein